MLAERVGFDAVLLGDGTVLAVGNDYACYPGPAGQGSETAERYDPVADAWTKAPSLNKGRKLPVTVTLDDGSAMVIGGVNTTEDAFSSTKIFTPSTGTWTDGPLLAVARGAPLAARLADGRLLAVSQVLPEDMANATTGELYDPAKQAWSKAASPKSSYFDQLVPMADGRALGVGKLGDGRTFEIYDPADDTWTMLDNGPAFFGNVYVPMHDGSFLTIGIDEGGGMRVARLDLATGSSVPAAPMHTLRGGAAIAVLADGRVLAAGGTAGEATALASTEIYDPVTDSWSAGPDLLAPRTDASAIVLDDGSVLILGGTDQFNTEGDTPWCPPPMTSVERFYPGS